ncbi:MAG: peptide chain release factor aRF-1, partial [Methanoregula sp.]|nr:peptide chain release factor aRF-1 [Methanoregula sp.]
MAGEVDGHTEFRSTLHELESKEGTSRELITLYIPPDKPIPDVTGYLKEEYTRAGKIQDPENRRQVQRALSSILSHLKNYDLLPGNGLALFCGAVSGETGTDSHCTTIEPPEPLNIYLYRRSTKFELEPLRQMLESKNVYGLLVLDLSGAWWGFLRGDRINSAGKSTSNIPEKQRKGGQSSARFQRLRTIAVNEFFSRAGSHASEVFLGEKDFFLRFRGLLIGGPGMTKEDFFAGHFLHHEIQKRVIGLFDTANTEERGLAELADTARDAIGREDTAAEKDLLERFRQEFAKADGLAVSGEERIRKNLVTGAVGTLLLSAGLRKSRRRITCQACGHAEERTIALEPGMTVQDILAHTCRICAAPIIGDEEGDIIEELTHLADKSGAKTRIIAEDSEGE